MLKGNRTYITGFVIIALALAQVFGFINFDQQQFTEIVTALGGLAAIFLRASVKK